MVDQGSCRWIKVPGTNVTLQIREGQPEKILGAFAADYNAYIEPLRDPDSACWTATNDVGNSNHLSGTGMDLNWNGPDGKTFRLGIPKDRAYPGAKSQALDDLLEFYEGMVFCGGYWSIRDWMHFQMGGNTYGSQNVEKVNDFIRRKIRADGFSTYKRGAGGPTPPPPSSNAVDVLVRATGVSSTKAREILPMVIVGLRDSQCNNVNRIAMWLAQIGHESGSFVYTEEIAKNGRYAPYIGRTWIQITWEANYRAFSQWCHAKGLVPTSDYFVVNYRELAELKWAGLGPAWYWTVARPNINAMSDKRDLYGVTQAINGGQNGAADRKARYDRALALGDQLLVLRDSSPGGDDDMSAEDVARLERKIDVLVREVTQKHPSRSAVREPNEGVVDTWAGMDLNTDGNVDFLATKARAELGYPPAIGRLQRVAQGGEAGRNKDDALLAQAILAGLNDATPAAVTPPNFRYSTATFTSGETTGGNLGKAFDAIRALQLSDGELDTLKSLLVTLQNEPGGE